MISPMTNSRMLSLALFAMITSACNNFTEEKMPHPNYNQAPKHRYEIALILSDPPGAFADLKGFANYEISDRTCLPPADNFQGVQNAPASLSIPIEFSASGPGRYVGVVSADALVDEDYYGHGVCHWRMSSSHVRLTATGASGDTEFIAAIPQESIQRGESLELYYLKQFYPRVIGTTLPDHGTKDPAKQNPAIPANGWFSMSLSAKALAP